ncbi:MAG: phosphorylcholine transferase LicD, partial [Eubacteriales bacterium]
MLKDFDRVCKSRGIPYTLFSGTALGAVRHQGFIPWDDDIDVIMLRGDYERFFDEAGSDFDSRKYYVQREYSAHWPLHFSKLRLNNTTCIEKFHARDPEMHQGVYIDIFPCDNLSGNPLIRRLQFLSSKVVIAKALYARGYETDSWVKKCFMQVCRLLPRKPFWKFCIRKEDIHSKMVHSFFGCGTKYEKNVFPREWFEETTELPFEDGEFPV